MDCNSAHKKASLTLLTVLVFKADEEDFKDVAESHPKFERRRDAFVENQVLQLRQVHGCNLGINLLFKIISLCLKILNFNGTIASI